MKVCPTGAWEAKQTGYNVRIGGKWGRNPLVGTLFATFLPQEQVVAFITRVLEWYREKAENQGRIRLGDIILKEGPEPLLERLRQSFPDSVVAETIPPQIINTQIGSGR